jgi:adenylate cyclase
MDGRDDLRPQLQDFSDRLMQGGARYTLEEAAQRAGTDVELARRLGRAMGLPDVPEGEPAFYEDDVDALRRVAELIREDHLDVGDVLYLARTTGLAAARMADAVVGFWVERGADALPSWGDERRVRTLEDMTLYLLRRHLVDTIHRRQTESLAGDSGGTVAVGFADLVGFTSLSEQLSDRETGDLIERFELTASEQVAIGGGRVIKMIGDEVMFAADPHAIGEIALGLAESFDAPDLPSVRVGVAAGHVLAQAGDLYGPVVNLAARATMAARPGSVLISPALASILDGDPRYRVSAIRPHRLKGIGVVTLHVLRRSRRRDDAPTRRAG